MPPTIPIFLRSDVSAFTLPPDLFNTLQKNHPHIHFVNCTCEEEFRNTLPNADAAITWPFKAEWYAEAPKLRAILTPAAGADWVQPDPRGKVPTIHGTFHGRMMSESLVGSILYFSRRLHFAKVNQSVAQWNRDAYSNTTLLENQTILIAGYGQIGRACAVRLKPFGCRIIGLQRSRTASVEADTGVQLITPDEFDSLLPVVDHIVSILPSGYDTNGFFSPDILASVKPGVYFHNIGRGNCIHSEDLIEALDKGYIAGAALDVFEEEPLPKNSPLWDRPDVLITPHASCIFRDYMYLYTAELSAHLTTLFLSVEPRS